MDPLENLIRSLAGAEVWNQPLLGNTVGDFVLALGAFFIFLVVFKVFQVVILNRLTALAKKTATDIDDTLIRIVRSIRPSFYIFIALYAALYFLALSDTARSILDALLIVWIVYQVVTAVQILIDYMVKKKLGEEEDKAAENAVGILGLAAKVVLWTIALLLILSNLGINITSLVAGLGIGGLAVALALQNILSDLFSSFAIYFDKPFAPGDFIVVGDKVGVVEKIGIKTTRLRALQGEEIVISNQELTSAQVQNFKKMEERRVAFSFGVTYETPVALLKQIPALVESIVSAEKDVRFDRAHFNRFDDSALSYDIVYYVKSSEYMVYMDTQQAINLAILEQFEALGISMAYPTQTLYIQKS